jgi:hypothetical protein
LFLLVLLSSQASAQEPLPGTPVPTTPVFIPSEPCGTPLDLAVGDGSGGSPESRFAGNRNFPNFIGFLSNPLQSIDPRAMTALYPIFGSSWIKNASPIPDGNFQLYGPALTVALSERLAVGLNQGGYAVAHFNDNPNVFFQNQDLSGQHEGWLNLGGFVQYTLLQDVPNQFLLTGGLRLEVPSGSDAVFQGHGPVHLAPYLTGGKEFGDFHVLATTGYQFPAGSGRDTTNLFYANLHLDRRMFGWLYPLVEFNWIYHVTGVDFGLPTRRGFIDMGNFEATGNILTLAAGANAVLVQNRLEFGAVYTTPLATQRHFDFNGLLVKMVLRY